MFGLHGMGADSEVRAFLAQGRIGMSEAVSRAQEFASRVEDHWDADPSETVPGWRSHDALACAALCLDMFPDNPALAVRRAVNIDGDSDTVGAITGALAVRVSHFRGKGCLRDGRRALSRIRRSRV